MPLLAAWLGIALTWLVENIFIGLTAWFSKLVIARLAFASMVTAAIVVFFALVKATILGINAVLPAWFGIASSWVFPSNLPFIITYYFTIRAAGAVFRYSRQIIWGGAGGGKTGMGSLGN